MRVVQTVRRLHRQLLRVPAHNNARVLVDNLFHFAFVHLRAVCFGQAWLSPTIVDIAVFGNGPLLQHFDINRSVGLVGPVVAEAVPVECASEGMESVPGSARDARAERAHEGTPKLLPEGAV